MDRLTSHSSTENNPTDDHAAETPQVHLHIGSVEQAYLGSIHCDSQPTAFDVDKKENDLRESLRDKIQVMTDLQESESLPLQVVKQNEPQQEVFGRRGWFDETSNEGDAQFYDMYELFEQSKISATERASQKCRSREAKEDYIIKNGNVVGANGIAGIGKTTMIKLIAKHTSGAPLASSIPLIFYVSLRYIDFSKSCSVLQFLTSCMISDWEHFPESDKTLLKRINEADDVFIFTDALDEARGMILKDVAPKMSLYDTATPDVIFKNIFSGHLLPKAKKLFTSRPGASLDLHLDYIPEFGVTVSGLSKESQELLFHHICENEDDLKKVKEAFVSNPTLSSLCFIPMFCKMITSYLLQNITSRASLLSSSDMFTFSLGQCVRSEHFKGDLSSIPKLIKLALEEFLNNKLIFDLSVLQTAGVDIATVDAFMNIDVVGNKIARFKILDGDKQYYFSHLLWHEFFSAIHLIFCSSIDQFRALSQQFSVYRWYSVVKFMFGLSNPLVQAKIQSMLPQITGNDLDQKYDALKSFLQNAMHQYCETVVHSYPALASYIESFRFSRFFKVLYSSPKKLFMICSWVYELQDIDVSKLIADRFPEQIHLNDSILPSDVTCLCYVLEHAQITRSLSIGTWYQVVSIVGEGLKLLVSKLRVTPHKLKRLHVKNQEINISDFIYFLNEIEDFTFDSCNLSLDDVQQILQVLRQRLIPIDHVNLVRNPIDPSSIEDFVRALPMVRSLSLRRCNLSEGFIQQLAGAVASLGSAMTSLSLSGNQIDRSIEHLSRCIHNIHYLNLVDCKLSRIDVELLANKIAELKEPMKILNLGGNEIGSLALRSLSRCIHKIQSLYLYKCSFMGADIDILTNKIKDLEQPMKLLDLGGNDIGSNGTRYLCGCLHKIQHLMMKRCELKGEDMETLADAVLQRHQPIESLQVSSNKIEDNGANAISRCLHKIKLLLIAECNLSEERIEAVRLANARNEQKCEIFGLDDQ